MQLSDPYSIRIRSVFDPCSIRVRSVAYIIMIMILFDLIQGGPDRSISVFFPFFFPFEIGSVVYMVLCN